MYRTLAALVAGAALALVPAAAQATDDDIQVVTLAGTLTLP